ncbi:hypothetical protein [Streptomyces aurantiogriseus]|uniref:hypothetical protein n=1 Tax=Streptomyces aurantiogriseus TaxID=66870 RepID=UPI0016720AA4|nr:hypothetical protein [Streptomyces aurantiogriseus]
MSDPLTAPSDRGVSIWLNVDVRDVTDPIRALVASGQAVGARKLADPDVPLDRLLVEHHAETG